MWLKRNQIKTTILWQPNLQLEEALTRALYHLRSWLQTINIFRYKSNALLLWTTRPLGRFLLQCLVPEKTFIMVSCLHKLLKARNLRLSKLTRSRPQRNSTWKIHNTMDSNICRLNVASQWICLPRIVRRRLVGSRVRIQARSLILPT